MATFGNEKQSQAPTGSRLAQYLNGRPTSSNQQLSGQQSNSLSATNGGYSDDMYGMQYTGGYASNMGYHSPVDPSQTSPNAAYNRNEELLAINQNIPFMELQLLNEDTLKQRWAFSAIQSFFADPDSRARLMQRQMAAQPSIPLPNNDLPEAVEHFHNLYSIATPTMRYGNHIEHVYKAISTLDGITYTIHRVTNARQMNSYARTQIDNWSTRVTHSNIIRLHSTLLTRSFNDSSQLFVYDFQPLAEPLSKHFYHVNGSLKSKYVSNGISGLNEQFIWQLIIHISSAIRTVHAANMAMRCLDLNRILVNSSGRFLISSIAIADVFGEPATNLLALQIEDLRNFGAVLVALLSGSIQAATPENVAHAAQQLDNHYSPDLKNVVKVLCHAYVQAPNRGTSINEIMPMIGARFYSQIENMQIRTDLLENDLCKELQNGRLFRLLGMLCSVCDRTLPREPYWSETSERYMLKLFRDYIFHQVDAFGRAILDLAHIVLNLNKLDSGLDEAVQLASRDNDNVLLVTYKELRAHLESSFEYLRKEMETEVLEPASIQAPGPI